MNAAKSKAVKRSWVRASRFAELAGITTFQARSYLANQVTGENKAILDNGADRRNKAVRTVIQEARAYFGFEAPVELLFDLRSLVTRYGEAEVVAGLDTYLYLQNWNT